MSIKAPVIAYLATCGDTVLACYRKGERNSLYLDGLKEPHYPVPAIRLDVDICQTWESVVAIFDDHNCLVWDYIDEQAWNKS